MEPDRLARLLAKIAEIKARRQLRQGLAKARTIAKLQRKSAAIETTLDDLASLTGLSPTDGSLLLLAKYIVDVEEARETVRDNGEDLGYPTFGEDW
jgi:hypothetical protein